MKLEERENYMSEFIKDIDKDLGTIISKKMHMQPVLAEKWSWKILNEYPEDLKNVIRKWAKDEQIPEIEYSRISLEMVMSVYVLLGLAKRKFFLKWFIYILAELSMGN